MRTFTRVSGLLLLALAGAACNRGAGVALPPPEATVVAGGTVTVIVDGTGYHPATIRTTAGALVHLAFRRISEDGCGAEVAIPSLHLQRPLPMNQTVTVDVPNVQGRVAFTCGMNMLQGAVVAQ